MANITYDENKLICEKIDGEELEKQGYCLYRERETVKNNIEKILGELNLTLSDLSRMTGISRQTLNAILKGKMKCGIEIALKISYVLNRPVEEIFYLTENAWIKPAKDDELTDSSLYFNILTSTKMNNSYMRKEIEENNGAEFYHVETYEKISREEYNKRERAYIDSRKKELIETFLKKGIPISTAKSLAVTQLKEEFSKIYAPIYYRIGVRFTPYVFRK